MMEQVSGSIPSFVPMTFAPRRHHVIDGQAGPNTRILEAVARALYWEDLLDQGEFASISDLARAEDLQPTTVARLLRLARLSPEVIDTLMEGAQPRWLSLYWLQRNDIPHSWQEQINLLTGDRP